MSTAPQNTPPTATTASSTMPPSNPLRERDLNVEGARSQKSPIDEAGNPPTKPANHHLNLLGKKRSQGQERPYISPSDAIQTPTTQKLAHFKQNLISKGTTRGPLFTSAPKPSAEQTSQHSLSLEENAKAEQSLSTNVNPPSDHSEAASNDPVNE